MNIILIVIFCLSLSFNVLAKTNSVLPASGKERKLEFTGSRPNFSKMRLKIGKHLIDVELAVKPLELSHGLMFVTYLPPNQGMLFRFDKEEVLSFWMKNTKIPLSIAYLDSKKKIVSIKDMEPESEMVRDYKNYSSGVASKYALEMNKGWFKSKSIEVGSKVEFISDKQELGLGK